MMKRFALRFVRQGLFAAPLGAAVLAAVYFALGRSGAVSTVSSEKVAVEILTVMLLAFIAGGVPIVYSVERLSLPIAILIHAAVLYLDYAIIYLSNGWMDLRTLPFAVFSLCFAVGFALIWLFIFLFTRRHARRLTLSLQKQREGK